MLTRATLISSLAIVPLIFACTCGGLAIFGLWHGRRVVTQTPTDITCRELLETGAENQTRIKLRGYNILDDMAVQDRPTGELVDIWVVLTPDDDIDEQPVVFRSIESDEYYEAWELVEDDRHPCIATDDTVDLHPDLFKYLNERHPTLNFVGAPILIEDNSSSSISMAVCMCVGSTPFFFVAILLLGIAFLVRKKRPEGGFSGQHSAAVKANSISRDPQAAPAAGVVRAELASGKATASLPVNSGDMSWYSVIYARGFWLQQGFVVLRPDYMAFLPVLPRTHQLFRILNLFSVGKLLTVGETPVDAWVRRVWETLPEDQFDEQVFAEAQKLGGVLWDRESAGLKAMPPSPNGQQGLTFVSGNAYAAGTALSSDQLARLIEGWRPSAVPMFPQLIKPVRILLPFGFLTLMSIIVTAIQGDMRMLVPIALFGGITTLIFVYIIYLWSRSRI